MRGGAVLKRSFLHREVRSMAEAAWMKAVAETTLASKVFCQAAAV